MNKDIFEGRWKTLKGKFKQQWGLFTDDEIDMMKGKSEELEGKLQEKYGYTKEKSKQMLKNFLEHNTDDRK